MIGTGAVASVPGFDRSIVSVTKIQRPLSQKILLTQRNDLYRRVPLVLLESTNESSPNFLE